MILKPPTIQKGFHKWSPSGNPFVVTEARFDSSGNVTALNARKVQYGSDKQLHDLSTFNRVYLGNETNVQALIRARGNEQYSYMYDKGEERDFLNWVGPDTLLAGFDIDSGFIDTGNRRTIDTRTAARNMRIRRAGLDTNSDSRTGVYNSVFLDKPTDADIVEMGLKGELDERTSKQIQNQVFNKDLSRHLTLADINTEKTDAQEVAREATQKDITPEYDEDFYTPVEDFVPPTMPLHAVKPTVPDTLHLKKDGTPLPNKLLNSALSPKFDENLRALNLSTIGLSAQIKHLASNLGSGLDFALENRVLATQVISSDAEREYIKSYKSEEEDAANLALARGIPQRRIDELRKQRAEYLNFRVRQDIDEELLKRQMAGKTEADSDIQYLMEQAARPERFTADDYYEFNINLAKMDQRAKADERSAQEHQKQIQKEKAAKAAAQVAGMPYVNALAKQAYASDPLLYERLQAIQRGGVFTEQQELDLRKELYTLNAGEGVRAPFYRQREQAYITGDTKKEQYVNELLNQGINDKKEQIEALKQLHEWEQKRTDDLKHTKQAIRAITSVVTAAAARGDWDSSYLAEGATIQGIGSVYNTANRAVGWLSPTTSRGVGFGTQVFQEEMQRRLNVKMLNENRVRGFFHAGLSGFSTGMGLGLMTGSPIVGLITGGVVAGAQVGRTLWNWRQEGKQNTVQDQVLRLQQTFNIMGLALEPLRMFGSLLGAGARALRGFVNVVLRIPNVLDKLLLPMARLGNPYTSLTGVTYRGYQRTQAIDRMVGLQNGATNASIEDFATQQRNLYDSGQYNQNRLVAAARMGLFNLVYANGGDSEQQYGEMVNQFATLINNDPTNAVFARQIDPNAAATAQVLIALRNQSKYRIQSYADMMNPANVDVYWNDLSLGERENFRVTNYQYQSSLTQLQNSGMRFGEQVWNHGGLTVFNAINRFIDKIASSSRVGEILDKIGAGISSLFEKLQKGFTTGDWGDLGATFKAAFAKIGEVISGVLAEWGPKIVAVIQPIGDIMIDLWGKIAKQVIGCIMDLWDQLSDITVDPTKIKDVLEGKATFGDLITRKSVQAIKEGEASSIETLNAGHFDVNTGIYTQKWSELSEDDKLRLMYDLARGPNALFKLRGDSKEDWDSYFLTSRKMVPEDWTIVGNIAEASKEGFTPKEYRDLMRQVGQGSPALTEWLSMMSGVRTRGKEYATFNPWEDISDFADHRYDYINNLKADAFKFIDENVTLLQHEGWGTVANSITDLCDKIGTWTEKGSKIIIEIQENGKKLGQAAGRIINGVLQLDGAGGFKKILLQGAQ